MGGLRGCGVVGWWVGGVCDGVGRGGASGGVRGGGGRGKAGWARGACVYVCPFLVCVPALVLCPLLFSLACSLYYIFVAHIALPFVCVLCFLLFGFVLVHYYYLPSSIIVLRW